MYIGFSNCYGPVWVVYLVQETLTKGDQGSVQLTSLLRYLVFVKMKNV
jgi:hypothetical protein